MKPLLFVGGILFAISLGAQSDAAFDWVLGPGLIYATYEDNPDKDSEDKMINLWFSDGQGTCFYPTIDAEPVRYDYVMSPYSRFLADKQMILIETAKGLTFADKAGKKLRSTSYRTLQALGDGGIYQGGTKDEEFVEVYDFNKNKVLFRVPVEGNLIERVGDYFVVSGYEKPTKIYNMKGHLLLEKEDLFMTVLETDELRILAINYDQNTKVIMDGQGKTVVELPRNMFDAKGVGDKIQVRLGAFSEYSIDLAGNKITEPFTTPLIAGEIEVLHNCGANNKVGAQFLQSGVMLPCEYDFVATTRGDSMVIHAKKGNQTYYFNREGKPLYDASPFTITRYLGGDYFVGARNGKCEIVRRDGRTLIFTDIYPIDPTRVANVSYLPDTEGGKFMVADKLMRNMEIYDTSGTVIYQRSSTNYSLNWGMDEDYIYITEGAKTGLIDKQGQEVLPIKYRNLEVYSADGEIKYLKTSQVYPDRVGIAKGGMGLLDGVAVYLLDAKTDEVIVSSNTGMRWISEDHLLLYFGTTYGVVRLK